MTKKLPKKKGNWKRAITVGAAALVASGAFWWLGTKDGLRFPVPTYRAMRVIDGDTFETEERQLIRLFGVQAPELNLCGGEAAKKALEKLVLHQNLYVKVIYRDSHFRLISHVYNQNGSVSAQMTGLGMTYSLSSGKDPALKKASDQARSQKLGIFSQTCIQDQNPNDKDCVIKGNVPDFDNQTKRYHFPGCGQYTHMIVELYKGDRWFCTEKEAKAAGFSKGADCFDKSWPNAK